MGCQSTMLRTMCYAPCPYEVANAGRAAMCEAMDIPMDGLAFALWASAVAEEAESSLTWKFKWFRPGGGWRKGI